jgi:hypothetical protein
LAPVVAAGGARLASFRAGPALLVHHHHHQAGVNNASEQISLANHFAGREWLCA